MNIQVEIWKDIIDFPNYQISNLGKIKSKERETNVGIKNQKTRFRKELILKQTIDKRGYSQVILYNNQKAKHFKVHRLVAEYFIENINNKPQVNHKDGNKQNNHVNNLEYVTDIENKHHAINSGLIDLDLRKTNMSKLGKSMLGVKARWKK